jgi:hypothetical protein
MRPLIIASFAAPLVALALPAAAQPAAYAPPGMCACPVPAAPMAAEPMAAAQVAPPSLPDWAIGLRLTSIGVHPADSSRDDDQTSYGGGGLEVRYRLAPRWELGLTLESAREVLDSGEAGDHELRLSMLQARFHLDPYARWDIYFTAGLGTAAIVAADQDETPKDAIRGAASLGAGIERRFGHFGIAAELRALSIAPSDHGDDAAPLMTKSVATPVVSADDPGAVGGTFTIAGSYEF